MNCWPCHGLVFTSSSWFPLPYLFVIFLSFYTAVWDYQQYWTGVIIASGYLLRCGMWTRVPLKSTQRRCCHLYFCMMHGRSWFLHGRMSRNDNPTKSRCLHLGFHRWQPGVSTGLSISYTDTLSLPANTLDADDFSCSFSAAYLLRAFKFKRCRTKVAIKVVLFMSHRLLYFLIAHMCLWAEFLHAASSRRIWSFNCIPCTRMAWAQGQHVCLEEGDFFTQNSCFSVLYPET